MRSFLFALLLVLVAALAVNSAADEQQKARKQLDKVTAMASDATGRRVVSKTVSDYLSVKWSDLVSQRRTLNLNYGGIFVAHQLLQSGAKMEDIAAQLKSGKDIWKIADEQHADWKKISNEAKKLNGKLDDNLYKHFLNSKADNERDTLENYDPNFDGVKADLDVTKEDLAAAQDRYLFWRGRAVIKDAKLDTSTEKAARQGHDHIRDLGPQPPAQGTPSGPN